MRWGLHFCDLGSCQLHMLIFKRTRELPGFPGKLILRWRLGCRGLLERSLGITTCGRKGLKQDWAEGVLQSQDSSTGSPPAALS